MDLTKSLSTLGLLFCCLDIILTLRGYGHTTEGLLVTLTWSTLLLISVLHNAELPSTCWWLLTGLYGTVAVLATVFIWSTR